MLNAKTLQTKTYSSLRSQIRKTISAGKARALKAVERERVRTAWQVGRLIHEHILLKKDRAAYGKEVIKRLSEDIGISKSELHKMVEFSREYPIVASTRQLPWGHYRELLVINDPKIRGRIEKRAAKNDWSQRELREEIKKAKREIVVRQAHHPEQSRRATTSSRSSRNDVIARSKATKQSPSLGKPGTYKIITWKGRRVYDLGFSTYLEINKTSLRAKRSNLKPRPSELYYYSIVLDRVVDGDTIRADVHLGFGIWSYQILRLKGIDAPERKTAKGKAAKRFLEKTLKKSNNILIRTTRSDKYDRYLADLWANNIYINSELIKQNYAIAKS